MKKISTMILVAMAMTSLSIFSICLMPTAIFADADNDAEKIFADAEKIKAFCQAKWPEDSHMQGQCQKKQIESIRSLQQFIDKYNLKSELKDETTNPYAEILLRCLNAWESPQFDTYDYGEVDKCVTRQVEAYEAFHK
jgi:hypothetical protein